MASGAMIVTGVRELDRKLAGLEPKLQRKPIKKATRAAAKKVQGRSRALTPAETGAMAAAMSVRAVSRNIKVKTGVTKQHTTKDGHTYSFKVRRTVAKEFGAKVEVTRASLAKQAARRGRKIDMDNDAGFYPAFVELGRRRRQADAPMRRGMKSAESQALSEFRSALAAVLANP